MLVVSDDERREVAERLREIELSKGGYVAWWKIAKALKLKQLDGWFGWEKFDPDSAKRLADLIEPGESGQNLDTNRDTVQIESPAVQKAPERDRETLLALADEIEYGASSDDGEYHDLPAAMVAAVARKQMEYARRIREALGVDDD